MVSTWVTLHTLSLPTREGPMTPVNPVTLKSLVRPRSKPLNERLLINTKGHFVYYRISIDKGVYFIKASYWSVLIGEYTVPRKHYYQCYHSILLKLSLTYRTIYNIRIHVIFIRNLHVATCRRPKNLRNF